MQKISTCLFFKDNAEEAAKFYTSIFKKSKKGAVSRSGDGGPGPKGSVIAVEFEIEGRPFMALNGNQDLQFNESVSFVVNCKDQKEVDYYWNKLTKNGGKEIQCGWCQDKFGVRWQIVPTEFMKMVREKSSPKRDRAFAAMMNMVKLDLKKLRVAYKGE